VAVNVGHPDGSDALERVLTTTMRTAFPYVWRDPVRPTNTILLGSTRPVGPNVLRAAEPSLPAPLRPVAGAAANRLEDGLTGGTVYTDDRAPVEWLVDKSIIDYAEGR
jgi:hypothetical protein